MMYLRDGYGDRIGVNVALQEHFVFSARKAGGFVILGYTMRINPCAGDSEKRKYASLNSHPTLS
jgi:hypothetical protein